MTMDGMGVDDSAIGFIGAGQMGWPMVRRIRAAGYPVVLFARRDEIRAQAAAESVEVVDSAAEVAARCPIVITCLYSDDQLAEVLSEVLGAVSAGAVIVSHTTGRADVLRDLEQRATEAGAYLVDAPVSGTATNIANGQLTVLLGGAADAIARVRDVLATYAATLVECGGVGDSQKLKLLNNSVFAANLQIAVEARRVAVDMGIDPAMFHDVLRNCSGDSFAQRQFAPITDAEMFSERIRPVLTKDVSACRDLADGDDVDVAYLGDVLRSGPIGDLTDRSRHS